MMRRCMWICAWCAAAVLASPVGSLLAEEPATFPASQPAAFAARARAQEPSTQPAGPICVAILEPEVLADLPAEQRKALAGAIETLLTESLAKQKDFVLARKMMVESAFANSCPPGNRLHGCPIIAFF